MTTSAAVEALIYDLVESIYNVVEQTDANITGTLNDLKLTRPLADVLWVLNPSQAPIPMGELASRLRCEPSTATFLIDRLHEKGLVQRGSDAKDRRRTTVALTDSGSAMRQLLVHAIMTGSPVVKLPQEDMTVLIGILQKALEGTKPKYRM